MPVTPEDVEAEHHKALDSLTREQRWALYRVQRAYQESHFNHRKIGENLGKIFADEARRRNEAAGQPAEGGVNRPPEPTD